ncbi:hypothetical protein KUTeg_020651 [Tegillarca granosa]|uniref:glutathione transferase n=1 Tax=Tegillarca granosa TaxID=220873 RepID=A0ABQ9EB18_TEGGR|nr:hypothetical protein KUTeg_020651 [Tegillarca granosa]
MEIKDFKRSRYAFCTEDVTKQNDSSSDWLKYLMEITQQKSIKTQLKWLMYLCCSIESSQTEVIKYRKTRLEPFENFIGENPWFAGQNVTVCDFHIYELLDQLRIMDPGCLDKFSKLKAFIDRFEALPKIKAYLSSSQCIKRPINNKIAAFK